MNKETWELFDQLHEHGWKSERWTRSLKQFYANGDKIRSTTLATEYQRCELIKDLLDRIYNRIKEEGRLEE